MQFDFDIFTTILLITLLVVIIFDILFVANKLRKYLKAKEVFRFKSRYLIHYFFIINIVFLVASIGIGYFLYSRSTPQIIRSIPVTEAIWENYDKPIEVIFNVPVDKNRLITNMNPLIAGNWVWEPYFGIDRLTKVGKFYPEETLFPNSRIVIYITGIGRLGNRSEGHEGGIVLQSVALPEVRATTPYHKDTNIEVDKEIGILFTKPVDNLADFEFKLYPETELEVIKESSTLYKLKPSTTLNQSTEYSIQVIRTPKRVNLKTGDIIEIDNQSLVHNLKFTTVKEPFIKSITPKGSGAKADSLIRFRFETEMDKENVISKIKTEPEIIGEYTWQDDRTLILTPSNPLTKATKYKVTILPGLSSKWGGISDKSIEHEFETVGMIKLTSTSPNNGESRVGINSNISITFDQEVDHESAQKNFSISPSINGTFIWEGNKMIFDPVGLGYSTNYSITLAAGIKSIDGIDNEAPLTFNFSTRSNEFIISMPLYYQPQYPVSFSCNIYAAKMALAWKGYNTTIPGLIGEMGYDTRQDGQGRWLGNPYQNYVGNSDGSWGYGAYAGAVKKVFSNRGIQTEEKSNWNLNELARSIENGNPVIIWRYNGTSSDRNLEWGSPGVYAINGQHGGVVTGFRGTIDNPTQFYINDPWFGLVWMDRNTFDYYWSRLNRSALIIY